MYVSPSVAQTKATVRAVAASFVAGASAMLFLGVIVPMTAKGALLSVRAAEASIMAPSAPLIEPLDVNAIEAQIAAVDAQMLAARAETDREIARLARLAPRR